MELDKSVLDSQVFKAFAETSKRRYIYMFHPDDREAYTREMDLIFSGQLVFFDNTTLESNRKNLELLEALRHSVLNIEDRPANQPIVEAVTLCARKLGIKVCIEGVETRKLIDFLEYV